MTAPGRTPAEIGALINKSERWVKRNAHSLPHHRFGQTVVFFDDDVTAILDRFAVRPSARRGNDSDELSPLPSGRRSA